MEIILIQLQFFTQSFANSYALNNIKVWLLHLLIHSFNNNFGVKVRIRSPGKMCRQEKSFLISNLVQEQYGPWQPGKPLLVFLAYPCTPPSHMPSGTQNLQACLDRGHSLAAVYFPGASGSPHRKKGKKERKECLLECQRLYCSALHYFDWQTGLCLLVYFSGLKLNFH